MSVCAVCGGHGDEVGHDEKGLHASQILPGLFVGGDHNAGDVHELASRDIHTIVNVAEEVPCFFPDAFEYWHRRWSDFSDFQISDDLGPLCVYIDERLKKGQKVLVHCALGRSRSGAVAVAYVMYSQNLGYEDALQKVQLKRPIVQPNPGFTRELRAWQMTKVVR